MSAYEYYQRPKEPVTPANANSNANSNTSRHFLGPSYNSPQLTTQPQFIAQPVPEATLLDLDFGQYPSTPILVPTSVTKLSPTTQKIEFSRKEKGSTTTATEPMAPSPLSRAITTAATSLYETFVGESTPTGKGAATVVNGNASTVDENQSETMDALSSLCLSYQSPVKKDSTTTQASPKLLPMPPLVESEVTSSFITTASPPDNTTTTTPKESRHLSIDTSPLEEPVDPISRMISRQTIQIDLMFRRNKRILAKPTEYSVSYFEAEMETTRRYSTELGELQLTGTDGHFLLIAHYMHELHNHCEELNLAMGKMLKATGRQQTDLGISSSVAPVANGNIPEPMIPFDGDILNWPLFSTSLEEIHRSIGNNPGLAFRLLYANLDANSRTRFLADIDPSSPNIPHILQRMKTAYETPGNVLPELHRSFSRVASLKHGPGSWMDLVRVAKLTKVLLSKFTLTNKTELEGNLVEHLLLKLPPKYQNMTREWATGKPLSLDHLIAVAETNLEIIANRQAASQPTGEAAAPPPSTLCLICEADYHHPEDCDFDSVVRMEAVRAKGYCFRCLVAPFAPGHACGRNCTRCGKAHHFALCPNVPESFGESR